MSLVEFLGLTREKILINVFKVYTFLEKCCSGDQTEAQEEQVLGAATQAVGGTAKIDLG
jgi:hypothetical protein